MQPADIKVNSFAAIASGSGRSTSVGTTKGKEIISDEIQEIEEHSKTFPNLNKLTINIRSKECGINMGDTHMVKFSLDIQMSRGPDGEWSVTHVSLGEGPSKATTREPLKSHMPLCRTMVSNRSKPANNKTIHVGSGGFQPTKPIQPMRPTNSEFVWRPRRVSFVERGQRPSTLSGSEQPDISKAMVPLSPVSATSVDSGRRSFGEGIHRTSGSSMD